MLDMTRPSLKMIAVGSACKDASPSPQKNEALKHYAAAVEARAAMREAESNAELDAATQSLALPPSSNVNAEAGAGVTKRAAVLISRVRQYGPGMPDGTSSIDNTFRLASVQMAELHNRAGANSSLAPKELNITSILGES